MARVALESTTITQIETCVGTYTNESGEAISTAMIDMIINMLVSKYIQLRSFPSSFSEEAIEADVQDYFEDHVEMIAYRIPMIVGRMGVEGEKSHGESGYSQSYEHGDPFYDIFPDVVQYARVW